MAEAAGKRRVQGAHCPRPSKTPTGVTRRTWSALALNDVDVDVNIFVVQGKELFVSREATTKYAPHAQSTTVVHDIDTESC
jgi:hypothetical protein